MKVEKKEKLKMLYNKWSLRLLIILILEVVVLLLGSLVFHQDTVKLWSVRTMVLTAVPVAVIGAIGATCEISCRIKEQGRQAVQFMALEYVGMVMVFMAVKFLFGHKSTYVEDGIVLGITMFLVYRAKEFRARSW